jgi:PAS domain S-box-containing protein
LQFERGMGHPTADAAFARRTAQETERLLIEQASWAFIFLDRDGYIEHLNPGAEAMFGYSAAEAAGKHFALIFPPEDVRNGVPQEELQAVLKSGHALKRGWKQRKDGTRFFANQLLTVLRDSDGNVVALAVTLRDATAEKKIEEHLAASEAELRLVVDSVRDYAIYLLDPDGTIRTWSRGAQQIKGTRRKKSSAGISRCFIRRRTWSRASHSGS